MTCVRRAFLEAAPSLVLAALAVGSADAQTPAQAGRWVADWGEQRCAIIRATGGDAALTLSIRLIPGQRSPELLLVDPAWRQDPFLGERPITIVLSPSGDRMTPSAIVARLQQSGPRTLQAADLGEDFLDRLARSSMLRVQVGQQLLADIPIPQAEAAVRALRSCSDALLRAWGVDPVAMAALQHLPKPIGVGGFSSWITYRDYPDDAIRAGASGTVTFRYTVELDGRVTDCTPVVSSGNGSLDRTACRVLLERGRYEPAIGPDGRTVRTTTVNSMIWVLPHGAPSH